MNKKNIIEIFMGKGNLLDKKALEKISDYSSIPRHDSDKTVLSEDDFEFEELRILKNLNEKPNVIDTNTFVNFYTSKYEKMKEIYVSRIDKEFISIDKVNGLKEFFILGIVREKKDNKIKVEDMSSSIELTGNDDLELDDVVALSCSNNEIKEIFLPDIPIKNVAKGKGKVCFASNVSFNDKFVDWIKKSGIKYFVFSGGLKNYEMLSGIDAKFFVCSNKNDDYPNLPEEIIQENIISLSNPSIIELNGVKIMLINDFDVSMLKKRYLGKSKTVLNDDYLVLDAVPDIINHNNENKILNYKSTTIVSGNTPTVIDLQTREVEEIRL